MRSGSVLLSTVCAVSVWQVCSSAVSSHSADPSYSAESPHAAYSAQSPHPAYSAQSSQQDRAALQREAEELTTRSRSLLGELQQLEQERNREAARVRDAELAMTASASALASLDQRLTALEQRRLAPMPELKRRFVDLYKRGRRRYVPLLMTATSVRDAARAARAAGALARLDQQEIAAQRDTLNAIRRERDAQAQQSRLFSQQRAAAEAARVAAAQAADARSALLRQVTDRRDLAARLAGEMAAASTLLQQRMTALAAEPAAAPANAAAGPIPPAVRPGGAPIVRATPLPFTGTRGALDWPVPGRITRAFGRASAGLEASATRNGIDIGADADTPVRAVHAGTVAYAEPFAGFGTLVILDHGSTSYTLYGYLAGVSVRRGDRVEPGQEVGRVGAALDGTPALYFEVRVDGRPVDPVQWLKPR
jgi:septal ring factor EnvC (AmiA/AmiB activator)